MTMKLLKVVMALLVLIIVALLAFVAGQNSRPPTQTKAAPVMLKAPMPVAKADGEKPISTEVTHYGLNLTGQQMLRSRIMNSRISRCIRLLDSDPRFCANDVCNHSDWYMEARKRQTALLNDLNALASAKLSSEDQGRALFLEFSDKIDRADERMELDQELHIFNSRCKVAEELRDGTWHP